MPEYRVIRVRACFDEASIADEEIIVAAISQPTVLEITDTAIFKKEILA